MPRNKAGGAGNQRETENDSIRSVTWAIVRMPGRTRLCVKHPGQISRHNGSQSLWINPNVGSWTLAQSYTQAAVP